MIAFPCYKHVLMRCSFLRGRKFPGSVRVTRTDASPGAASSQRAAAAGPGTAEQQAERAASPVADRQARSLHGEPSTSQPVCAVPFQLASSVTMHHTMQYGHALIESGGCLRHSPLLPGGWAGC